MAGLAVDAQGDAGQGEATDLGDRLTALGAPAGTVPNGATALRAVGGEAAFELALDVDLGTVGVVHQAEALSGPVRRCEGVPVGWYGSDVFTRVLADLKRV